MIHPSVLTWKDILLAILTRKKHAPRRNINLAQIKTGEICKFSEAPDYCYFSIVADGPLKIFYIKSSPNISKVLMQKTGYVLGELTKKRYLEIVSYNPKIGRPISPDAQICIEGYFNK